MKHIVLDIETGKAPEDDLLKRRHHIDATYREKMASIEISKTAQKRGKAASDKELAEKMEKLKEEQAEKEQEVLKKANLYDTSPINVIGLLIDGQTLILTTLPETSVDGLTVQYFNDEETLLRAAKGVFESFTTEESMLITFNGYRFDVPRILCRMGYYGITIPAFLREVEHFDVMYKFCKHFSIENSQFIKFHRCCELLGVNGKVMEFKEAEQVLESGDVATFLNYNALDLVRTYQCYQRMT